jgi:N-acetylneuraminic acid mutarotase
MKCLSLAVGISLLLFLAGCASNNNHTPPPPSQYTISGTVVDLATGSGGVALQDNGGDNLTVTANGNFVFATKIVSGSAYSVTVMTQPASPAQQCTVANGSGTATTNVSNIKVECGHNEWAWMTGTQSINQIGTYGTLGTRAAANTPGGRQFPATWTDGTGNLWLFGGYGYDSNNNLMPMSDLWEFSAGQWTWMGGPTLTGQSGNYGSLGVATTYGIPGARFQPASWTDASGNLWLFGGNGFDSVGNESPMNDLWKYSGGEWTWVGGSSVGKQNGHYGTLGVADASNEPGGRCSMAMWKDSSGDIWVFGGLGYDAANPTNGSLNDLWKYSGGVWTWMGGATAQAQKGVYGTKGVAAATNIPGAREDAYNWVDSSGNLWLFGGLGYDSTGTSGYLNDLWKYSGGQWTWVGGSNVVSQPGIYGTKGTASANNVPGARWAGITWVDAAGNAWLFGGTGFYAGSSVGFLNDLWEYSGGQWTWVSGANTASQNSTYGTEGTLAPGNTPGSRFFLNGWVDANENLWLFGGYGQVPGANGNLNDLWMYMP